MDEISEQSSNASIDPKLLKARTFSALPPGSRYRQYLHEFTVSLPDRTWPERMLEKSPVWCSVDLRDGNQALKNPLTLEQKVELFQVLVAIGFKEIEISFPAASAVEYDFTRLLIEENLIPDQVMPQLLTQARAPLIDRTFQAIEGAKQAIVHLYNSTSEAQRRIVFDKSKKEITTIATDGVRQIIECCKDSDVAVTLQYSPESFTGTELPFARDICRAVVDLWQPTADRPMILNLPATVEVSSPNVHADQIEWMIRAFEDVRDCVVFSLHTHNDRGTAVASTELALLAGADRVEGTLFGNGERTGNVDILTVALNLYSQGVDPGLCLGDVPKIRQIAERLTELPVHPRHPYAGELVFTAFSGSHQDAVSKGLAALKSGESQRWEVPYLLIDPADIGREYEPLIRINSQSGKGGVAFVLDSSFGYELPKKMHPEVSKCVQAVTEQSGSELSPSAVFTAFEEAFLKLVEPKYSLRSFRSESTSEENGKVLVSCSLEVAIDGEVQPVMAGAGNGPIDACKNALMSNGAPSFKLNDYSEHALQAGSDAQAAAYIQISLDDGRHAWGAGQHENTTYAAITALLNALSRAIAK